MILLLLALWGFRVQSASPSPCESASYAGAAVLRRELELTQNARESIEGLFKAVFAQAGGDPAKVDWEFIPHYDNFSSRLIPSVARDKALNRPKFVYGRGVFDRRYVPAGISDDMLGFVLMNDYFHEAAANRMHDEILEGSAPDDSSRFSAEIASLVLNQGTEYYADRRALEMILRQGLSPQGAMDLMVFMNEQPNDGRLEGEGKWVSPAPRDRLAVLQAMLRVFTQNDSIYKYRPDKSAPRFEKVRELQKYFQECDSILKAYYASEAYADDYRSDYEQYYRNAGKELFAARDHKVGVILYAIPREVEVPAPPRANFTLEKLESRQFYLLEVVAHIENLVKSKALDLSKRLEIEDGIAVYLHRAEMAKLRAQWELDLDLRVTALQKKNHQAILQTTFRELRRQDANRPGLFHYLSGSNPLTASKASLEALITARLPRFLRGLKAEAREPIFKKLFDGAMSTSTLKILARLAPAELLQASPALLKHNTVLLRDADLRGDFFDLVEKSDLEALDFAATAALFRVIEGAVKDLTIDTTLLRQKVLTHLAELARFDKPEEILEVCQLFKSSPGSQTLIGAPLRAAILAVVDRLSDVESALPAESFGDYTKLLWELLENHRFYVALNIRDSLLGLFHRVYQIYAEGFLKWNDESFVRVFVERAAHLPLFENRKPLDLDTVQSYIAMKSALSSLDALFDVWRNYTPSRHNSEFDRAIVSAAVVFDPKADPRLIQRIRELGPAIVRQLLLKHPKEAFYAQEWMRALFLEALPDPQAQKAMLLDLAGEATEAPGRCFSRIFGLSLTTADLEDVRPVALIKKIANNQGITELPDHFDSTFSAELVQSDLKMRALIAQVKDIEGARKVRDAFQPELHQYGILHFLGRERFDPYYHTWMRLLLEHLKPIANAKDYAYFILASLPVHGNERREIRDDVLLNEMLEAILKPEHWTIALQLEKILIAQWPKMQIAKPDLKSIDECFVGLVIEGPGTIDEKLSRIAPYVDRISPKQRLRLWAELVVPQLKERPYDPKFIDKALKTIFKGQRDMQWIRANEVANLFWLDPAQIDALEALIFPLSERAHAYVGGLRLQSILKQLIKSYAPEQQIDFLRWLQGKTIEQPLMAQQFEKSLFEQNYGGRFLREEILELPHVARAALLLEFVTPYSDSSLLAQEHPERADALFNLLVEDVVSEQRDIAKIMLQSYVRAANRSSGTGYQFVAEILAGSLDADQGSSWAEQLKTLLEVRGSLWIKMGQMLGADPELIPDDATREVFQVLNERASEPRRREIYSLLEKAVGATGMAKIKTVKQVLGSGSINVTVLIELHSGKLLVARLLKNDAGNSALFERDVLIGMAEELRLEASSHNRSELLHQIADALEEYGSMLADKMQSESDLNNDRRAYALLHDGAGAAYENVFEGLNTEVKLAAEVNEHFLEADTKRAVFYDLLPDIKEELKRDDPDAFHRFEQSAWLAEWEALYLGRFDPDGHLGNWRVSRDPKDPSRLVLTRIDYSQAESLSPLTLKGLRQVQAFLLKLQHPGLLSVATPSLDNFVQIYLEMLCPVQKGAVLDRAHLGLLLRDEVERIRRGESEAGGNPVRLLSQLKGRLNQRLGPQQKTRFVTPVQMAVKSMFLSQQLLDGRKTENEVFIGENFLRLVLQQSSWQRAMTGANLWMLRQRMGGR